MPRKKRQGDWVVLYTEVPASLKEAIQAIAEEGRRPVTTEIIMALEEYVANKKPKSKRKDAK